MSSDDRESGQRPSQSGERPELVRARMLFPHAPVKRAAVGLVSRPLEWLLGITELNRIYADVCALPADEPIHERALRVMGVSLDYNEDALADIPQDGPLVIVANHPFGGIEGLALLSLLRRARPDTHIMVNYLLGRVFGDDERVIYVDPFDGDGAEQRNTKPLRQTYRCLRDEHALAVFPSGAVSHPQPPDGRVVDPAWDPTIGRLITKTGAQVVPVYFDGQNSASFQALGRLHPLLRTAMLVREFVNKQGQTLRARIGQPITPAQLRGKPADAALAYVRSRVYNLSQRADMGQTSAKTPTTAGKPKIVIAQANVDDATPIADPADPAVLEAELAALPADRLLMESGPMQVWLAHHQEAPTLMDEIGRAREITFRAVGEGTGQARDVDRFDDWYDQLVLWDSSERRVTGGYRIGRLADILPTRGVEGLYTSTLYDFQADILARLESTGLELGRSFVCHDYQRRHNSLFLLWQAIGRYVARRPEGCILFGTVSFSADYDPISHRLAVAFLNAADHLSGLAQYVHSRQPVEAPPLDHLMPDLRGITLDLADLTALIADLESDRKGVPVLLRQYLKLGGKVLGFNRDPDFGNTLDVLMMVDLRLTDQRLLSRYMGKEAFAIFSEAHAEPVA